VKPEEIHQVVDHVARRIGELRTEVGLTQADVAERLGMTLTNYQRIEHGLQNLTLKMMVRVANAIGAKTAELFAPMAKPHKRQKGRPKKGTTLR
jgi:transcriptional regulator with XRE-family HTH domain